MQNMKVLAFLALKIILYNPQKKGQDHQIPDLVIQPRPSTKAHLALPMNVENAAIPPGKFGSKS